MAPIRYEVHNVSVEPNDSVVCSCKGFQAGEGELGGLSPVSVAYAHRANPRLPLEAVLAFVGEEPVA